MFSLALWGIDLTTMAPVCEEVDPAAPKAGGAPLPLRHVLLHKWRQVTPLQETQVLT